MTVPGGSGGGSGSAGGGGYGDGGGSGVDGGSGDGTGNGGGSDEVSTAEKVVMVVSVGFTALLFGFALWQALTGPGALAPTVSVVGSQQAADGEVVYTVALGNPGDVGLVSATVEAGCADPPTEVTFENVPADGRRVGTVVCPPGTNDPELSVVSWIQE